MMWEGFWLVVTVCLRIDNITRYHGCGVWTFTTCWGTLLHWRCPLQLDR
jgi:hypothetical protein